MIKEKIYRKLMRILHPSQAWFWSDEWQEKEKEVDRDIKEGRYETFVTLEQFLYSLKDNDD